MTHERLRRHVLTSVIDLTAIGAVVSTSHTPRRAYCHLKMHPDYAQWRKGRSHPGALAAEHSLHDLLGLASPPSHSAVSAAEKTQASKAEKRQKAGKENDDLLSAPPHCCCAQCGWTHIHRHQNHIMSCEGCSTRHVTTRNTIHGHFLHMPRRGLLSACGWRCPYRADFVPKAPSKNRTRWPLEQF